MRPRGASPRFVCSHSARRWLPGGIGALLLALGQATPAFQPGEAAALLQKADRIKTAFPAEFTSLVNSLAARLDELTPPQQELVRYLQAWKDLYDGQYDIAISRLRETIRATHDVTLQFRAKASIINALVMSSQFEDAFAELTQLLVLLPKVTDPAAREQGLIVAAQLYSEVGQYDLAIAYSQKLMDENWLGRGVCKGYDWKLRSEVMSGRLSRVHGEFNAAIDACTKLNELSNANFIRSYAATVYLRNNQVDEALRLLTDHYGEVLQSQFPRLIYRFESLLASAYQKKGNGAAAHQFALRAIDHAVPNEISQPLVVAYHLLYEQARTALRNDLQRFFTTAEPPTPEERALYRYPMRRRAISRPRCNTMSNTRPWTSAIWMSPRPASSRISGSRMRASRAGCKSTL